MTILGVGHALVDAFAFVGDEVPSALGLHIGSFNKVPDYRMRAIVMTLKSRNLMAGGSAANTVKLAAQLGLPAFFSSCIGTDHEGQLFESELLNSGVRTFLQKIDGATGTCVTFLTPSQKNTIATFRSASGYLPLELISESALEDADIVLIEGYLLDDPNFVEALLNRCKIKNRPVCLSLGAQTLALEYKDQILSYIKKGMIAYLFTDEAEASILTDSEEEEALRSLSPMLKGFVINRGDLGSQLLFENRVVTVPRLGPATLDPTGARDALVAGFLWGTDHGLDQVQACQCGTLVASAVSQIVGTRLDQSQIDSLLKDLKEVGR